MAGSSYEAFWNHGSFAVVGDQAARNFPRLTYRGLKKRGKVVFAVDPSADRIDGDPAYASLADLPQPVEAVVLEVPPETTRDWIARAADANIRDVWIHMTRDTPEALELARARGLTVCSGTCAVMYLTRGFTYHSIHRWIMRLARRY